MVFDLGSNGARELTGAAGKELESCKARGGLLLARLHDAVEVHEVSLELLHLEDQLHVSGGRGAPRANSVDRRAQINGLEDSCQGWRHSAE